MGTTKRGAGDMGGDCVGGAFSVWFRDRDGARQMARNNMSSTEAEMYADSLIREGIEAWTEEGAAHA